MSVEFSFTSHKDEVLNALASQIEKALTDCGLDAEGFAKEQCPVDTGNLRNSVTFEVGDKSVTVGTNVNYAPYVELGTGIYYEGGRQTPWTFQDSKGDWHMTRGQKAQPFIKPAIADHIEHYKQIITEDLKS